MGFAEQTENTINDIYNLPDGQRAELINGQIFMMAPPSTIHQRILHFLDRIIGNYINEKQGKCEVFPAPFAVFLDANDKTYVEPDISVICDRDKLTDKGCTGAPDWIIEIVSPSSRRMDYYKKLGEYRDSGVKEYWIIDPMKQIVVVYNMAQDDAPVIYRFTDSIKVNIYEDCEIDFSKLSI